MNKVCELSELRELAIIHDARSQVTDTGQEFYQFEFGTIISDDAGYLAGEPSDAYLSYLKCFIENELHSHND